MSFVQACFKSTFLPMNLNFAFTFFFMSQGLLSLLRLHVLDRISKGIKIFREKLFGPVGWRSIRIENSVGLHIYCALWFLIWLLIHFIISLVLFEFDLNGSKRKAAAAASSNSSKSQEGRSDSSGNGKSSNRQIIGNYMPVTGILALCLFIVVYIPAIPVIRKRFYDFFYYTHHFFILAAIALGYHSKRVNPLWMTFACIYVVDRIFRMISIKRTPGFKAYQWSNDLLELVIDVANLNKKNDSKLRFGLVYLIIPSVTYLESHPFDVCFEEGDKSISLFIKKQGKWTSKLFDIIAKKSIFSLANESKMTIVGKNNSYDDLIPLNINEVEESSVDMSPSSEPKKSESRCSSETEKPIRTRDFVHFQVPIFISSIYQSSHRYIFENDVAILVASGSGISPMLSIIFYFIRSQKEVKTKKIYLFWANKNQDGLQIINRLESKIINSGMASLVAIQTYYKNPNPRNTYFDQQESYFNPKVEKDSIYSSFNKRMDVFKCINSCIRDDPTTYGILCVGNSKIKMQCRRASNYISRKHKYRGKIQYYS
ncbi:Superoxide-generating NADPH oxidase heavy chain subunit C [Smittium mucronatum]|uniref:Superoxide-generating NADPH oxidase heavy chain subunit C n=1 Tax=Smittium mucronatum TaxID=133383 RepID=A0A1R0GU65_9FUNG|nr:Superoxide-generating NADPH oxidase heavy chain subunit C [Smittium mucronatum]